MFLRGALLGAALVFGLDRVHRDRWLQRLLNPDLDSRRWS
jgi:hypothetical protein